MNASLKSPCPEFSHYMREFRNRLKHALDENKWYLSEQEGHDVGEQSATQDFLQRHFDRFAEEIRTRFCEHQCARQKECPLSLFIRSLPPSAKALEVHKSRKKSDTPAPC
ncbi:MAG: hypothetical protein R6X19_09690 [Kiritimatiellia bacterium]